MTYHILKSAGLKVGLAGNVGDSFAKQVIEDTFDYFVLELSSFQLDNCYNFKADIAILLNITPDHLDRYEYNFQNYVNSKFRILQNMTATDHFIYFQESEALAKELTQKTYLVNHLPVSIQEEVAQGAFVQNGILEAKFQERDFQIEIEKLPIKGTHNSINASCAVLASQAIGLSDEQITTGILSFQSVEHRLEPAGIVNGVSFVNDSKATNVDSVFYALGSFNEPIVLIMGGVDKGNDYSQIDELVANKVKALVCMGTDNHKLFDYFGKKVPLIIDTKSMKEAVETAANLAVEGDVVLLSPACASFDLFKNYEDRGRQFKQAVKELPNLK